LERQVYQLISEPLKLDISVALGKDFSKSLEIWHFSGLLETQVSKSFKNPG
jgi:hypothetical protein